MLPFRMKSSPLRISDAPEVRWGGDGVLVDPLSPGLSVHGDTRDEDQLTGWSAERFERAEQVFYTSYVCVSIPFGGGGVS